jgi:photosystem II stability/assembly factor-like uncharacterized protein
MRARRLTIAVGCGLFIAAGGLGAWLSSGSAPASAAGATRLFDPTSVWFLNRSVGWVDDSYGQRLLMTTNGGRTWVNVSPPALGPTRQRTRRRLAGVAFESRSNFWAAVSIERATGRFPVELLHTTNAGRTWTDVNSFAGDYGYVWIDFLNQQRGWVMVDNGAASDNNPVTVYRTDSGGRRWIELARSSEPMRAGTPGAPSSGCDKSGISFSDATSGWITGYCSGGVYLSHTTDGGTRWRSLRLTNPVAQANGSDTLPPQFFTDGQGALAADLGGARSTTDVIYTTAGASGSWTPHAVPTAGAPGRIAIVSQTVWIAAAGHTLYTTTNAGASWQSVRSSLGFSGLILNTFDFVSPTDGWAITNIGQNQQLWRTTTGGVSWTRLR